MPAQQRHLDQTERHRNYAAALLADDSFAYIEWVPVISFYAAYHYVNAYLATQPGISHRLGHDAMQRYVAILTELRPIQAHYFALFNDCNAARYELQRVYRAWAQQRFDRDLEPIRRRVTALLQA